MQVLYVPDPEYVSSAGSSPSLSPISPLSPTSSEAELEKVTYTTLVFFQNSLQGPIISTPLKRR